MKKYRKLIWVRRKRRQYKIKKEISKFEVSFFAKLITAVLSLDNSNAGNAFVDVNTSDWYSGYISSAVRVGIINGYSDGTFKPNSSISRLEMAVIAGRALKLKGYKVPENS
ncbi:MAG TPA: hypothetical protein DEF04_03040 [Clostridiales bacterium]|nr:hypothetical protein [Clostridiales bacterium]